MGAVIVTQGRLLRGDSWSLYIDHSNRSIGFLLRRAMAFVLIQSHPRQFCIANFIRQVRLFLLGESTKNAFLLLLGQARIAGMAALSWLVLGLGLGVELRGLSGVVLGRKSRIIFFVQALVEEAYFAVRGFLKTSNRVRDMIIAVGHLLVDVLCIAFSIPFRSPRRCFANIRNVSIRDNGVVALSNNLLISRHIIILLQHNHRFI